MHCNLQTDLLVTLRTLNPGGTFAIHDIFSKSEHCDMQAFVRQLKEIGCHKAELIDTTDGTFMTKGETTWMGLFCSAILTGDQMTLEAVE